MKILKLLSNIFDKIITIFAWTAALALIFIWLSLCFDVFMRYITGDVLFGWVLEISEYALLFITFMGAAWLLGRDGHVRLDVVTNRLGDKGRCLLDILVSIIGAIVCGVIAWAGALVTWRDYLTDYRQYSLLELPTYPLMSIIALGSFLLFIQFLRRINRDMIAWKSQAVIKEELYTEDI